MASDNEAEEPQTELTVDEIKNLTNRRKGIRKWVTLTHKAVSVGCRSGPDGKLVVTVDTAEHAIRDLLNLETLVPDRKEEEYYEKLKEIIRIVKEEEKEKLLLDAEKKRIETEQSLREIEIELTRMKIEKEKAKVESVPSSRAVANSVRLDIKIPPFDGSPCHYRKFEELFESIVEKNKSYDDASKYLYFINLIGHWANEFAPNLSPTIDNLKIVKDRMRQHFEDPGRVREHVRKNFEKLPTLRNPSQTLIFHRLIVAWEEGVLALRKSGTTDDQIDNTYIRLMTTHLPATLLKECGFQRDWTVDEFLEKLKEQLAEQRLLNEYTGETSSSSTFARDGRLRTHLNVAKTSPTQRSPIVPSSSSKSEVRHSPNRNVPIVNNSNVKCAICNGTHLTIYCNSYDVQKRREIAEQKGLCDRCLRSDHHRIDCKSKYRCPCGQPHSRVLCGESRPRPNSPDINVNATQARNIPFTSNNNSNNHSTQSQQTEVKSVGTSCETLVSVTIPTPVLRYGVETPISKSVSTDLKYSRPELLVTYYQTVVVDINGQKVRVLLDGAAGRSIILESCANRLNLPEYSKQEMIVGGLGGENTLKSKRLVSAALQSLIKDVRLETVLSVVPSFGRLNPASIPDGLYRELARKGIALTDTPYYHCQPIEIILGLESFGVIWLNMEQLVTEDICVRESIFGHTAFGVTYKEKTDESYTPVMFMHSTFADASPVCTAVNELTMLEQEYLDDFVNKKVMVKDKRVHVQLPWLTPTQLGTNEKQAYDRFTRLHRSLVANGRFAEYSKAMNEMITNFAEPAPLVPDSENVYVLPHHCVVRLDKETTRIRIVYDGSAAEKGYKSINDSVFKGVNSLDSLDLLLSFRFGKYAFLADIEKAFLQIKVDKRDRDALRFWWFNEEGQPMLYRFNSVPFGTSASPFLLYAAMYKLFRETIDNKSNPALAEIARLIKDRFYVDDLIIAVNEAEIDQIDVVKSGTMSIFESVSMNVRKWRTNIKELDSKWSPDASSIVKFLGHYFNVVKDTIALSNDIPPNVRYSVLTKRMFSSLLSKLYDPMGLISPYVVHLRLFLRKLWQQSLDWDEPIPEELRKEALDAVKDAHLVNQVELPRNILPANSSDAKLIVFCDASKHALGAVAYSVVNGQTHLVYSKSRLVRLTSTKKDKDETIAELELDALVMGAEVANRIIKLFAIALESDDVCKVKAKWSSPFSEVIICSDSLLNLQRLVKHPNDQKPSISLRINRMKRLVPNATYRHVVSKENPADLISRGCLIAELLANEQWFHPSLPDEFTRFDDQIPVTIAATLPVALSCKCHRFGSYKTAAHAWRYIAQGLRRCLSDERRNLPANALGKILMIKYLQRMHFRTEIEDLTKGKSVDRDSVLKSYNCFVDDDGILRLRTRLQAGANLSIEQVKPIILPAGCHITELIVQYEHQRLGHPGGDRTMFAVRDQFFVFGLRKYVRRLISQCMVCKKIRGKTLTADYGMVPKFRYEKDSTPFTNVGIDILGPLKVAMKTPGKRYAVIFACATTRTVHLEPIHNMTAEQVFRALLNFIARRGIPHLIYSDNGLNLIAVKKQLLKFFEQISKFHAELDIRTRWIHLTAASPWRGGFYERLIRTLKDTLLALTFGKTISNDDLATSLYQIEARINSRPLFVYEGQVVTPSHFFAKRPLTQLPPIGSKCYEKCDKPSLIRNYKVLQSHINAVWNAWQSQYLLTLRAFHQNLFLPNQSDNLRVGDAVILKNPTPAQQWPFGIVEEVIKSEDGKIRTVQVRTTDRGRITIKARDIRTLIPFECTQEVHEEEDAAKSVEARAPDIPQSTTSSTPDTALTGSQSE